MRHMRASTHTHTRRHTRNARREEAAAAGARTHHHRNSLVCLNDGDDNDNDACDCLVFVLFRFKWDCASCCYCATSGGGLRWWKLVLSPTPSIARFSIASVHNVIFYVFGVCVCICLILLGFCTKLSVRHTHTEGPAQTHLYVYV